MVLFLKQGSSFLLQSILLLFTVDLEIVILKFQILLFLLQMITDSLESFLLHL